MNSIPEEILDTFDGWLRYCQGVDPEALAPDELNSWRSIFDDVRSRVASTSPVGLMNLRKNGDYLYAVTIRDGSNLWLTLWVRRSQKGELFICHPQNDPKWNAHTSYHRDGTLHLKRGGLKIIKRSLQPPNSRFKGAESLGLYGGHGGRVPGAICDPNDFTGVVEVPREVLNSLEGAIAIDLVQPGIEPIPPVQEIFLREIFCEVVPHMVITVLRTPSPRTGPSS